MSPPVPLLPHVLPADAKWVVIVDFQQDYEGPTTSYYARRQDAEEEAAKWKGLVGPIVLLCEVNQPKAAADVLANLAFYLNRSGLREQLAPAMWDQLAPYLKD